MNKLKTNLNTKGQEGQRYHSFAARLNTGTALKVLGVSIMAMGLTHTANAQTVDDEIVVTGMRASVEAAQKVKQNASGVVDAIVAEDIGKLPDNNVAEALARLSGIQIRRDSGEGNSVLIRGLPNVVTLLNGREVYSTSGRFINLAEIPSNILQSVVVHKSNSPELIAGGIAGTIDVRTRRATDNPGFNLDGNARIGYNDKAKSWNPNLGATISNTWDTKHGEFGALLALSYTKSNYHEERAFNVEFVDQSGFFNDANPAPTTPFLAPFVMGYIPIAGDRERPSANLALDWRPSDSTKFYFDGFVTKLDHDFELDFFVGLPLLGNGDIQGTVLPGTNIAHTITNKDVFTITSTQANEHEATTQQYALGGSHEVGNLVFSAEAAYTKSDFEYRNPIVDVAGIVPEVFVSTNVDGTAQINYGGPNFDITSGDAFHLENFFDNHGSSAGESFDFRGDVAYTPDNDSALKEVKAGIRIASRDASAINSFVGGTGAPVTATDANDLNGFGCVSEAMASGGPDYVMTQWFTPCSSYLLNNTASIREIFTGSSEARALDPGSLFEIKEKTLAAYIQASAEGSLGEMPLFTSFGARVVQTKEDLNGNLSQDTDPNNPGLEYTPINRNKTTTEFLPSVSAKLELTDKLYFRAAAGRSLTRPNFSDLNPGVSLSTIISNTTGLTGGGGNPNLDPTISSNFDSTLEYYFAPDGFVSASVYHRKFTGYIQPSIGSEVFGGLDYRVTRPGNTGDGTLSGFELSYQQFYDQLPGALSGLGLQANLTYMDGDTTNADTGTKQSITGLSDWSLNLIGLYEYGKISARLAYNWRDEFLDVRNIAAGYDLYVDTTSQVDGQVSYAVNDQLTLTLEGINLLDTHFKDYFEDPANPELTGSFPRDTRRYDRTIFIGARYKF